MNTPLRSLDAFGITIGGTMLVEASAGTGKTHTITSLVVRLVLEEGIPVRKILVVTFTTAAMTELRDRIRRRLRLALEALRGRKDIGDKELLDFVERQPDFVHEIVLERAERALRELDLAAICTIHSFCQNVLREHAFESGARYGLELMPDTTHLVREVADDYWAHSAYRLAPATFDLAQSRFSLPTARTLVTALARRPLDMPVLPPAVAAAASDADAHEAWTHARAAWRRSGAAIRTMLSEWQGLNKASHGPAKVGERCDELDAWFASEDLGAGVPFEALHFFSPARLLEKTNKNQETPAHPTFALLARLHDELRRFQAGLGLALRRGAVDWTREELGRRKESLRVQGFEDLLFTLHAALRAPRGDELRARIGERYYVALIDEFQDTDPVQYEIFRALFHGRTRLLLVGDPKQSIYAFRGADVYAYANAKTLARDAYTLAENRRSDPSLVKAVNTIFGRIRDPFMLASIGFQPVAPHTKKDRIALPPGKRAFEILFLRRAAAQKKATNKGDATTLIPRLVAAEIATFLRSGARIEDNPVKPGDIAVLTRTNAQAHATQAELRKLLIPTTLQSEENVFRSDEALDLEVLLRATLEPTRSAFVRSALATVTAGTTADELARLDADEHAWERASERFRGWSEHWTEFGFIHAFRRMLTELRVEGRLLGLVDGERRVTNLLHLGELLHGVEARERLGPTALLRWLGIARAEANRDGATSSSTEAAELRLESDAHAVQLLTIHKSKGLEFPIVYCPFLYDIRLPSEKDDAIDFHDASDGHTLKVDVAPEKGCPALLAKEAETRAEHQRLLYVALTRAKHRCSIVWGSIAKAKDSALAYAFHQPESGDALVEATTARYDALDDDGLRADLDRLAAASGGTIGVYDLELQPKPEPWSAPDVLAEQPLAARPYTRKRVDTWFRVGSFSALAQRDAEPLLQVNPEALGVDHDEADEPSGGVGEPARAAPPVLLHAFPRGAKPGTMLHAIFEDHDFTSADPASLRALVKEKLEGAGYMDADHGDLLAQGLRAVLDTPLDGGRLTLATVPRARRIDELEFVLPVAPVAPASDALTVRRLAEAVATSPGGNLPADYAARLGTLRFLPLRGFLKGFIDLVFEHDGRFYVVDYKSNHLGNHFANYDLPSMTHAMVHHDYFLQYHLYSVAVHRWLGRRMRGYDFEKHFGGVYYLFLRGMAPDQLGSGVFFDRPPLARLEAISAALEGRA